MTSAFDSRLVQAGLQIKGSTYVFKDLDIHAAGTKFYSAQMNTCTLRISNLTKEQRQDILTKASPIQNIGPSGELTRSPIFMTLDIGRQSSGLFRLFEGDVFAGAVSQPPDISITLNSLTNNFLATTTTAMNETSASPLSKICQQIANANGLSLDYKVEIDKTISNFSYTGTVPGLIYKINQMGGIIACVDNGTLIVRDSNTPRSDSIRLVNAATGMVGVPQATTQGCSVMVMADNTIQIGNKIRVNSSINPSVNGDYIVHRMDYEIANREDPFWYTLECFNPSFYTGVST